jgi:hypothetical protein
LYDHDRPTSGRTEPRESKAVENRLLGFDHERLTYRDAGRDFRSRMFQET